MNKAEQEYFEASSGKPPASAPRAKKQPSSKASEQDYDYFESAENEVEPAASFVDQSLSDLKNYAKNIGKAALESLYSFGQKFGPTLDDPVKALKEGKSRLPRKEREEAFEETLDDLIPSEEGGPITKIQERFIKTAPNLFGLPGGAPAQMVGRGMVGAVLGEGAKELGFGELGQGVAELTAFIGPDIAKKLLESGKNADLIKAAKAFGMTDEQIAPLLQPEFKQRWLSKLVPRQGRTKAALQQSKEAVGEIYNTIKNSPDAKLGLTEKATKDLASGMSKVLEGLTGPERAAVMEDIQMLFSKPLTGESVITFWNKLRRLGEQTDMKAIELLKTPLTKAINQLSPQLAKDFKLANDLYGRYAKIAARLKPNLTTNLVDAAHHLGALIALVSGNPAFMFKIGGERLMRSMGREMLINPRLQNLASKMVNALNENKVAVARGILEQMADQFEEKDPEIARIIRDQKLEEFMHQS